MWLVRRLVVTDAGDRWHRQWKRDKKCHHASTHALGLVRPKSTPDLTNDIRIGHVIGRDVVERSPNLTQLDIRISWTRFQPKFFQVLFVII
jgi:hypothetical protein